MSTLERAAQQWYNLTYQDSIRKGLPFPHPYGRLSYRWAALYGSDAEWAAWCIAKDTI